MENKSDSVLSKIIGSQVFYYTAFALLYFGFRYITDFETTVILMGGTIIGEQAWIAAQKKKKENERKD